MKITNLKIYNIYEKSYLIILSTDEGIEGIGQFIGFSPKSQIYYLRDTIKPALIGENCEDIKNIWNKMYWQCQGRNGWIQVISAIDIALHDIYCKQNNIPLWKFFGAKEAKTINLYWSMGHGHKMNNREMLDLIVKGQKKGFNAFKIRMDWHEYNQDKDPEKDILMAKNVRDQVGENTSLGFDANAGYSADCAISQSKKLSELNIKHFEEPVNTKNLLALKKVIEEASVPISFGEYEKTFLRFTEIVELTGLEILQPDILNIGGLTQLKYLYDYSLKNDLKIMPHSPDVGILSFASLHIYSTIDSYDPHEYSDELCARDDNIVQEYFNEEVLPKNGQITLTNKPGIGLSINKKIISNTEIKYD